MKSKLISILCVLFSLIFTGCGSSNDDPEEVAEQYIEATFNNDMKTFLKLTLGESLISESVKNDMEKLATLLSKTLSLEDVKLVNKEIKKLPGLKNVQEARLTYNITVKDIKSKKKTINKRTLILSDIDHQWLIVEDVEPTNPYHNPAYPFIK